MVIRPSNLYGPYDNFHPQESHVIPSLIRRVVNKVTSSGIELVEGNNSILSDTLNVYTDGSTDGYVASNSLPNYGIVKNITSETLSASNTDKTSGDFSLREKNIFDQYGVIAFEKTGTNNDIDFIQGDAVIYTSGISTIPLLGLQNGGLYYLDVLPEVSGAGIHSVRLYNSRA